MGDRESEDAERFSSLFRNHYQELLSFSRRRVDPAVAPDVVAETFLVAWRRLHDAPDHALPWLYRIAGFQIANMRRGEVRRGRLLRRLAQDATAATADTFAEDSFESVDAVLVALQSLREVDQEVLRLAAWEGLGAADAAMVLGCTVSAYRVRLHRARRRLERRAQESTLSRSRAQSQRPPPTSSTKATAVTEQWSEHI
jgi:RNA polymerase sigma-70 factor (ECF subfamily)